MELWVNGEKIGEHVYGYTPFRFDITPHLNDEGEINTIAVKTRNAGENSRWFAGAGIYRPVHISILRPGFDCTMGCADYHLGSFRESASSTSSGYLVDNLPEEGAQIKV